jgi:quinol monooxygenase YgiN
MATTTLFVKHAVQDFGTWKSVYDALGPTRQAMGVTGASVHQDPANPNVVTVTHQFSTLVAAQAFAGSDELKNGMKNAGLAGAPDIWLTDDVEHTAF